jgi:hypothetical protein
LRIFAEYTFHTAQLLFIKVLLLSLTQKVGEVKRIIDVEVSQEISIVCIVETREVGLKHTFSYL